MRWEYLLLGTEKSHLSLTEEEEDGLNDDDDVENLVSLSSAGLGSGTGSSRPVLLQADLTPVPHHVYVYWWGMCQTDQL